MGRSKKWSKPKKRADARTRLSSQTQVPVPVASGTADDLQIPGFVYDSEHRRYFRIPRAGDVPGLLPACLSPAPVARRVHGMHRLNVCRSFQEREVRGPSTSFDRVIGEHELRAMSPKLSHPILSVHNVDCLCFAGGGPDDTGVGGMLSDEKGLFYFELGKGSTVNSRAYKILRMFRTPTLPNAPFPNVDVLEMRLMKNHRHQFAIGSFQATSSKQRLCLDKYSFNGGDGESCLLERSLVWNHFDGVKKLKILALSVAFDEAVEQLAIGGERRLSLLKNRVTNTIPVANIDLKYENAHSVCFVDDGRGLLVGTHHGNVYRCDFRSRRACVLKVDTGRHLLCDLKPRGGDDDDRMIVCSGFNDYLALVDLRSCRQVLQYDEHVNRGRKLRVNINRSGMDAMSCTGYDGRTRIWNLMTGGRPVVTFDPPPDYVTCRPVHSALLRPWSAEAAVIVAYANNVYVYNA